MKLFQFILAPLYLASSMTLFSCESKPLDYTITAVNNEAFDRKAETIEVLLKDLKDFSTESHTKLAIVDAKNKKILSQLIDLDQDGVNDYLIFQTNFKANQTKEFKIVIQKKEKSKKENDLSTFCRIVPERIDDFAWENDKVAFI